MSNIKLWEAVFAERVNWIFFNAVNIEFVYYYVEKSDSKLTNNVYLFIYFFVNGLNLIIKYWISKTSEKYISILNIL